MAQGTESQQELVVRLVGTTILTLLVPYATMSVIALGVAWIPPTWFTPSQFDACSNWTVYVSVAPLIRLQPQNFVLAVPTRAEEDLYERQLIPPLHHLAQTLLSAQERLFSRVVLAVQIVPNAEVVNKGPPCT